MGEDLAEVCLSPDGRLGKRGDVGGARDSRLSSDVLGMASEYCGLSLDGEGTERGGHDLDAAALELLPQAIERDVQGVVAGLSQIQLLPHRGVERLTVRGRAADG